MDRPDISAPLQRMMGDEFALQLRDRLIELADATDDEAYASRLRLVASGKRPLRTLLADPQWRESFAPQLQLLADPPALDEEQRRTLDDVVEQARQHVVLPSRDEVASDIADVMRRAALTKDAVRQDELGGWTYVHDVEDAPEDPDAEGR